MNHWGEKKSSFVFFGSLILYDYLGVTFMWQGLWPLTALKTRGSEDVLSVWSGCRRRYVEWERMAVTQGTSDWGRVRVGEQETRESNSPSITKGPLSLCDAESATGADYGC